MLVILKIAVEKLGKHFNRAVIILGKHRVLKFALDFYDMLGVIGRGSLSAQTVVVIGIVYVVDQAVFQRVQSFFVEKMQLVQGPAPDGNANLNLYMECI